MERLLINLYWLKQRKHTYLLAIKAKNCPAGSLVIFITHGENRKVTSSGHDW